MLQRREEVSYYLLVLVAFVVASSVVSSDYSADVIVRAVFKTNDFSGSASETYETVDVGDRGLAIETYIYMPATRGK